MSDMSDFEAEARQRSQALENQGKVPYGFTAQHYPLTTTELTELRRLKHAGALATDADTYVALARGQSVHPSRLNQEQVRLLRLNQHRAKVEGVTPHRGSSEASG